MYVIEYTAKDNINEDLNVIDTALIEALETDNADVKGVVPDGYVFVSAWKKEEYQALQYQLTDEFKNQDFIRTITAQLQIEILKTVKDYRFWSIESMRTHALDTNSPLNNIATKLSKWEQSLINRFMALEEQINNGELDINTLAFDDEFTPFNESDWNI